MNEYYEIDTQHHTLAECDQVLRGFDEGRELSVIATSLACELFWAEMVVEAATKIKAHNKYLTKRGQSRLYPTGSKKLAPPMVNSAVEMTDCFSISKKLSNLAENQAAEIRWAANYLFENKQHGHNYINFRSINDFERYLQAMSLIVDKSRWLFELALLQDTLPALSRWASTVKIDGIISTMTVRDRFKFPDGQVKLYFLKQEATKILKNGVSPDSSQSSNALQYVLHLYAIFKKAVVVESRLNSATS